MKRRETERQQQPAEIDEWRGCGQRQARTGTDLLECGDLARVRLRKHGCDSENDEGNFLDHQAPQPGMPHPIERKDIDQQQRNRKRDRIRACEK